MNREWSDLNKSFQVQLRKGSTFPDGIKTLMTLRQILMDGLFHMKQELRREDFNAMPFPNANGYHSKTIAYSVWHIFRIEDIVAHSLIQNNDEIFRTYQGKIGAPIITTGNELAGRQIEEFSRKIDLDSLYAYAITVKDSTDALLKRLSYRDLRRKFDEADKTRLRALRVVSTDENACWLIDYWCGKDIGGLLRMPFSRHWMMHIEASMRIKNKIYQRQAKTTMYERMLNKSEVPTLENMTAYCGGTAALFTELNEWLSAEYGTAQTIVFPYGSSYGWGISHKRKGKLVCNVFPENGAFAVMLRMSDTQFASVYDRLGDYAKNYIDNKYPCNDGGWIHYRVTDKTQFEDVQAMLIVKCGSVKEKQ